MLNSRIRITILSLAMSLVIMNLTTGCSVLKKKPAETQTELQTETQTESETERITESETESETEIQTDIAYTSQDKSIRITLPDSTWKVTQDADENRVFSSGTAAMINIVHAADANAMKNITVAESEDILKTNLTNQYSAANAFEVVEFEKLSSDTLDTYEYVVKYNSTSMWAYSVTYGILAKNEAYVVTGTILDDNKVLLEAVQKSVESFTVLNNPTFNAMPGTAVNKTESETQSESNSDAASELKSLTDYGTSATLYVNGDTVNIRQQPSTEAGILGTLVQGNQVTVVGETSQWFKVNINGNIGYISKALLVNTPTTQTETSQTSETVSDSTKISAEMNSYVDYGTSYTYYTTTDVNMRTQPGTGSDSNIVSSLDGGTAVAVIGETDNWFVVSVNGSTGYISKSYISSENTYTGTGSTGTTGNGNTGGTGGTPTSGTGTISGTVVSTTPNTVTVQGDDGKTYTLNYTDASVDTHEGMVSGLYISATVDYSGTSPSGELYATSITGY